VNISISFIHLTGNKQVAIFTKWTISLTVEKVCINV